MPVGLGLAAGAFDPAAGRRELKVRKLHYRLRSDENRPGFLETFKPSLIRCSSQKVIDDRFIAFIKLRLFVSHGPRQPAEYLLVGKRLSYRFLSLDLGRDGQIEVRSDQVVEFQEAGRWEEDIRVVGSVGLE